jgi:TPP-dependent pyruvate/acetoin dehydrogenase alpha subunit
MEKCPVKLLTAQLVKENILGPSQAQAMKERWRIKADEAYRNALKAPWPDASTLEESVY